MWKQLWRWCLRRHPRKRATWIKRKYFTNRKDQDWVFFGMEPTKTGPKAVYLTQIHTIPIKRHIKVRGTASPDDPNLIGYWEKRRYATVKSRFSTTYYRRIAQSQNYRCPICSGLLSSYEEDILEGLTLSACKKLDSGAGAPTLYHASCMKGTRGRIAHGAGA